MSKFCNSVNALAGFLAFLWRLRLSVTCVHPYLLLNYQGRSRDVMTLAHELGHGVHQVLAAGQGLLMADTPLTLAETASVFGEQLTFRALLARESTPERRRIMLANKVEDMLNTVVRGVSRSASNNFHWPQCSCATSTNRSKSTFPEATSAMLLGLYRCSPTSLPSWRRSTAASPRVGSISSSAHPARQGRAPS